MTNGPTKLQINDRNWIVAYYADGSNMVWGESRTERGAKGCLTRYAKRCGLTVKGRYAD